MTTGERLAALERELDELKAERAAPTQRTAVQAWSFRLVDTNGKTRAILDTDLKGVKLVLFGEEGMGYAALVVDKRGPKLVLADGNRKVRAMLGVGKRGPKVVHGRRERQKPHPIARG